MNICGLRKISLLDYPGYVAATVFFGGCNFRCPFCHNASLVLPERIESGLTEEEFFAFLAKRVGRLDGVCISGGEPLLQKDILPFIEKIRTLGYRVKLDTNGSRPKELCALIDGGLVDYVAMDIKNSPARYGETVGIQNFDLTPIRESVSLLLEGRVDYEFRTTVCAPLHTPQSIAEAGEFISGAKAWFLQGFTDSGDLVGQGISPLSREECGVLLAEARKKIPNSALRGIDEI